MVRRKAAREDNASRHHGTVIRGPAKHPSIKENGARRFKGGREGGVEGGSSEGLNYACTFCMALAISIAPRSPQETIGCVSTCRDFIHPRWKPCTKQACYWLSESK